MVHAPMGAPSATQAHSHGASGKEVPAALVMVRARRKEDTRVTRTRGSTNHRRNGRKKKSGLRTHAALA
eukprot:9213002-Lingulodinium_polyedra.AAC.1